MPLCVLGAALAGAAGLAGQSAPTPDEEVLSGYTWRYVGPAIAGGRITDVEVVPGNSSHWYVGAASGGVFESRNHGVTWRPVFDDAPNLSVGDIALAPSDPTEVWVGTGEANNRNSSPWGAGVFHSSDGGKTWNLRGLEETRHIGKIIVHPADPTILYAAAYPRRRRAWGFAGGGPTGGVHRSTDGGESWFRITAGLPEGDIGRIGFEVWPRDPNVVVAIVEAEEGGVFRSDDAGETWRKLNSRNPRPMYYSQVRLDPNDDDVIYVLGTNLDRSTDVAARPSGRCPWSSSTTRGSTWTITTCGSTRRTPGTWSWGTTGVSTTPSTGERTGSSRATSPSSNSTTSR